MILKHQARFTDLPDNLVGRVPTRDRHVVAPDFREVGASVR
jgi:hypothetical protein